MATISSIWIFPIKSFDGVMVERASIARGGSLVHDRQWAITDHQGKFVNGKKYPQVHQIRAQFDLAAGTVELTAPSQPTTQFQIATDNTALTDWLSHHFGFATKLIENTEIGFPDDTKSPGPTIISTTTLESIASWYPDLDVAEVRRRLRTNIELDGLQAFEEDQLFDQDSFQLGQVRIIGINPCQRCVVPTRDSFTGVADQKFQKVFSHQRSASLPVWTKLSLFNHFYRAAVNTKILGTEVGKSLQIGNILQN
jgi:uncharacterized protein YcbX